MRTFVFIVVLWCHYFIGAPAAVRNGYTDVQGAHSSLARIKSLLREGNYSFRDREAMKSKRDALMHYILWHQITENFLLLFKMVSPDLYGQMDSLKDSKGRVVEIYVRFVAEKSLPPGIMGLSNIDNDQNDAHAYRSEFGANTASVVIGAGKKSLQILAHEFGHVQYQVQNLAEYFKFYNKTYRQSTSKPKSIGHNDRDESGRSAKHFVSHHHENYRKYRRHSENRIESYLTWIQKISQQLKK